MEERELETWRQLRAAFPILGGSLDSESSSDPSPEQFDALLRRLSEADLVDKTVDLVLTNIEIYLRKRVAPEFWSKFDKSGETDGFERFKSAVDNLYAALARFAVTLERLDRLRRLSARRSVYGEGDVVSGFKRLVRATLLALLPLQFRDVVDDFYKRSFDVFRFANGDPELCDVADDLLHCGGCGFERDDCRCRRTVEIFREVNAALADLRLLERLAGQVLTDIIQSRIENHVQESCKGTFNVSHVETLERWLDSTVMSWLTGIYRSDPAAEDVYAGEAVERFRRKLCYFLYETYTRMRIDQLFNIIIEYPDSQPAVDDIKICLSKTDLRSTLSRKLQLALETRLLHPGVNTPDILTAYISAIKALRYLDPSGVLLVAVTQPIRNYLRTRDDTVRSVVSSLTEEGHDGELADELDRVNTAGQNASLLEEEVPWDQWYPDPVDADPDTPCKYRRNADIITMLVNVYGSKELFVNEYRTLLADRLLAQNVYNAEKELRYLELLKVRFGESQLHFCDVMLKDISDSKRINALINLKLETDTRQASLNALVLSAQFWPPFKEESLELLPEINEQLEIYTKAFEKLKGNRTLAWKSHLGTVDLEIELGNKKLDLTVSPTQATLIMHFQRKSEWHLNDLSQEMKIPCTVLRRKLTYWQSMGILSASGSDKYVLNEGDDLTSRSYGEIVQSKKPPQEMICEDEEEESPMASAMDQREGELQMFWSYIVGMITNLDSMPLERIHQMLKMFASQGTETDCSLQELRHFLETKVRNHQLVFQAGLYKLPKT